MFRLVAQAPLYNAHAPFDGPPDAFAGFGLGTLLHRTHNLIKAVYSFAVNGGALGTILLNDDLGNPAILPPGAVVTRTFSNWTTAVVGAGGSIALNIAAAAAGDIKAAAVVGGYTGLVEGLSTGTAASMIALGTTATGYQISMTVTGGALTVGVGSIYVFYVL